MKAEDEAARESAVASALSSIKKEARFPHNVFVRAWDEYFFFESYRLFDDDFIEFKDAILDEEGSSHIALVNLGNAPAESDAEPHFVFLNKDTSFSEYFSILTGDGSPLNWMYLMDRYVCASDKSGWCIYCEKQSDIAVLAVKRALSTSNLPKLRSLLKAETIEAIDELKADPFFNKLVPSWKRGLMAGYGH